MTGSIAIDDGRCVATTGMIPYEQPSTLRPNKIRHIRRESAPNQQGFSCVVYSQRRSYNFAEGVVVRSSPLCIVPNLLSGTAKSASSPFLGLTLAGWLVGGRDIDLPQYDIGVWWFPPLSRKLHGLLPLMVQNVSITRVR